MRPAVSSCGYLGMAMDEELRPLVAGGCRMVQIEELSVHYIAAKDLDAIVFMFAFLNHGCPASTRPRSGSRAPRAAAEKNAVGILSHRNTRVEAVEGVAADIQRALESITLPPRYSQ